MDEPRSRRLRSASELEFSLRSLHLSQSVCEFRNYTQIDTSGQDGSLRRACPAYPYDRQAFLLEMRLTARAHGGYRSCSACDPCGIG